MKNILKLIEFGQIMQIAKMAKDIWYEYYLSIISQAQIDFMLNRFYSEASLVSDIEMGVSFYFIQIDSKNVGFLAISEQEKGLFFIHKFYLFKNQRGNGVGSLVFKELIQLFPEAKEIRLQVNRKNTNSINFYFKNGFKIEKWADFEIGNGFEMNDYIMLWNRP